MRAARFSWPVPGVNLVIGIAVAHAVSQRGAMEDSGLAGSTSSSEKRRAVGRLGSGEQASPALGRRQRQGKDCHLLGIAADCRLVEAERAWRELKVIYADGSLAAYGLIEESERQKMLEELAGAYARVARRLTRNCAGEKVAAAITTEQSLPTLSPVESAGEFLRQLRENAGLSLKDVAQRTKISPMRLEQIERDMYERLPAAVYLRGFVLEYANALGFSRPQEVAGLYLNRYQEIVRNPCEPVLAPPPGRNPFRKICL